MEKTLTNKQKTIGISVILLLVLCTTFISYAVTVESDPTIVTITAPEYSVTGEGIEVDLKYTTGKQAQHS